MIISLYPNIPKLSNLRMTKSIRKKSLEYSESKLTPLPLTHTERKKDFLRNTKKKEKKSISIFINICLKLNGRLIAHKSLEK